mmetsp:Transcript_8991/g.27292  ORF Transcript_8991/g.27292 Transcript_8991/m.27292 type:complete len:316 (-) Transcript_8991:513-1460(-)
MENLAARRRETDALGFAGAEGAASADLAIKLSSDDASSEAAHQESPGPVAACEVQQAEVCQPRGHTASHSVLGSTVPGEGDRGLSSNADDGSDEAASSGDAEPKVWVHACEWVGDLPKGHPNKILPQHYRTIYHWKCGDPAPLVPGGVPCLRLEVRGGSFMLHQIRHMVGAAVAVAHGVLPLTLMYALLAPGSRGNVPRAPPHCLLLSDCSFAPFRKVEGGDGVAAQLSGEMLQLRSGGRAAQRQFRSGVFDAALNDLLLHPHWERFQRSISFNVWPQDDQDKVVAEYSAWRDAQEAAAKRRQERGKQDNVAVLE